MYCILRNAIECYALVLWKYGCLLDQAKPVLSKNCNCRKEEAKHAAHEHILT